MCPFCFGAAAWAVAGVVSAGGLGVLAGVIRQERGAAGPQAREAARSDDGGVTPSGRPGAGETDERSR